MRRTSIKTVFRRLLRRIFNRLASLVGVPEIQTRLDTLTLSLERLEREALALKSRQQAHERLINKQISETVTDLKSEWNDHLDEVQKAQTSSMLQHVELVSNQVRKEINDKSETLELQLNDKSETLELQISELRSQAARHRRYVDNLKISTTAGSTEKVNDQLSHRVESPMIDDASYVALEDFFRGSQETITERQRMYVPIIRDTPAEQGYVLDLGCGRGEWLELLRTEGIQAEGLDSNRAAVEECRSKDLPVHHGDLVEYLKSLPDETCRAITLFQVLEHLPFPILLEVFREATRVLVPGGVLIGEVPNSETLLVAATTFWIDPTHNRPLFPGLLKFLAQETGFARVEGMYSTPLQEPPEFSDNRGELERILLDLHQRIYGHADFALVAWT